MNEFEYWIFLDNEIKRKFVLTNSCIKKINPNNPIQLFLIGGARIGKTFVLRLINQELKQLYNKNLQQTYLILSSNSLNIFNICHYEQLQLIVINENIC